MPSSAAASVPRKSPSPDDAVTVTVTSRELTLLELLRGAFRNSRVTIVMRDGHLDHAVEIRRHVSLNRPIEEILSEIDPDGS